MRKIAGVEVLAPDAVRVRFDGPVFLNPCVGGALRAASYTVERRTVPSSLPAIKRVLPLRCDAVLVELEAPLSIGAQYTLSCAAVLPDPAFAEESSGAAPFTVTPQGV